MPNNKSLLDDMDTLALIDERDLSLILDKLYREGGYDFRSYKRSSMARRISRRLKINKVSPVEYLNILDSDPEEYNRLFSYLTIKVSEFFRDPRVFAAIKNLVIPALFHSPHTSDQHGLSPVDCGLNGIPQKRDEGYRGIRVWCCGCAQGEEAYSIGILFLEYLLEYIEKFQSNRLGLSIFATDIDEQAIELGRKGGYSADSIKNLNTDLLEKYFNLVDGNYKIIPFIRSLIRFGIHDLVRNFPIAHQDLILCRNVLIYFNRDLQEKVFEKLYYALKPGGFLVLGKAEVPPLPFRRELKEVARKEKIYQKRFD